MTEKEVVIRGDYITLGQLLKLIGAADSGASVKRLLEIGEVTVNDEPESRRGRKLRPGDLVFMPPGVRIRLDST